MQLSPVKDLPLPVNAAVILDYLLLKMRARYYTLQAVGSVEDLPQLVTPPVIHSFPPEVNVCYSALQGVLGPRPAMASRSWCVAHIYIMLSDCGDAACRVCLPAHGKSSWLHIN